MFEIGHPRVPLPQLVDELRDQRVADADILRQLSAADLAMLLSGVDLASVRRTKRYRRPAAGATA